MNKSDTEISIIMESILSTSNRYEDAFKKLGLLECANNSNNNNNNA